MGPNGSENFKMLLLLEYQRNVFKLLPNIPPNGPDRTTFAILEILSFRF